MRGRNVASRLQRRLQRLVHPVPPPDAFAAFGDRSWIAGPTMIQAPHCVHIGEDVKIQPGSWFSIVEEYRGQVFTPKVSIGDRTAIGRDLFISCIGEVTIDGATYSLHREGAAIAARCGDILGTSCTWTEHADAGFPDDTESPGPTFVTEASVAVVARGFGFEMEATRRRFRCNIEIGGTEAFWEDFLYGRTLSVGSAGRGGLRIAEPSRFLNGTMQLSVP